TASWISVAAQQQGPLQQEKLVYIKPGSSINAITQQLMQEGAIDRPLIFEINARWRNLRQSLKAGEYKIPPAASAEMIIALLQSGRTHQRRLTIPEGLTSAEIVEALNAEEALSGEIGDIPPEGSLLPETYQYSHLDSR